MIMAVLPRSGRNEIRRNGFFFNRCKSSPGEDILPLVILFNQLSRIIHHGKHIALGNIIVAGENNAVNDV